MSVEGCFLRFRDRGDAAALGAVFDALAPRLLPLALHLCADAADAEDALQATFVVAIERAGSWDQSRPLQAWLCGILNLQCKRVHERRGRRRECGLADEHQDPAAAPPELVERRELVASLRQHVERLPKEQRQALLLQLQHGLQPAEIAEVLEVPPGTVRVRLHRGLMALRKLLPAGLAAWLFGALPARGLAAVRQAVLQRAGAAGAAAGAAGLGTSLLLKRTLAAALLLLLGIGGLVLWAPPAAAPAAGSAPVAEPVAAGAVEPVDAPVAAVDRVAAPAAAPGAAAGTATLVVRVQRAADGAPLPQAAVRVIGAGAEEAFATVFAVTGSDGSATFAGLLPGRVRVDCDRGGGSDVELAAAATAQTTIAVAAGRTARGRVVDAAGAPVPFASLWIDQMSLPFGSFAVGTADAFGEFLLRDLQAGAAVGATHPAHAPSWCVPVSADATPIVLQLGGPGATVAGRVRDAAGRPLAGAQIEIGRVYGQRHQRLADGTDLRGAVPQRLVSDADGCFRAAGLAVGEVQLLVRAPGHVPHTQHVATLAGAVLPIDVQLAAAVQVRGCVRDLHGTPLAGASVQAEGIGTHTRSSTRTDADGRFALSTVDRDWLALRVHADGFAMFLQRTSPGPGPHELDIALRPLHRLRPRLVDGGGAPLCGWQLSGNKVYGEPVLTDADGRATVLESPYGPLQLWLAPPGSDALFACDWLGELPLDREFEVAVPDRRQPDGWLRARVVTADGAPFAGVAVVQIGGRHVGRWPIADGQLQAGPLPGGEAELSLHGKHGPAMPSQRVAVPAQGTADLGEIRLPPTGQLSVRGRRPGGGALNDATLFLDMYVDGVEHVVGNHSLTIDVAGRAEAELPAGRYRYLLWSENARQLRGTLTIAASATTELLLQPEAGTRRGLYFPVPLPEGFGQPANVRYVLRDPTGAVYDQNDFDPGGEMPYYTWPVLFEGRWQLELETDAGRRFVGAFTVDDLAASSVPVRIAVRPVQ